MAGNTVFELVGEAIVAADEELSIIITWNHSVTFNSYYVAHPPEQSLEPLDCRTRHDLEGMSIYQV